MDINEYYNSENYMSNYDDEDDEFIVTTTQYFDERLKGKRGFTIAATQDDMARLIRCLEKAISISTDLLNDDHYGTIMLTTELRNHFDVEVLEWVTPECFDPSSRNDIEKVYKLLKEFYDDDFPEKIKPAAIATQSSRKIDQNKRVCNLTSELEWVRREIGAELGIRVINAIDAVRQGLTDYVDKNKKEETDETGKDNAETNSSDGQ